MAKLIRIEIEGQIKEGFWLIGFFIVHSEKRAYYKDDKGIWRFLPLHPKQKFAIGRIVDLR